MNLNIIGGALGVAALVAIFYFHPAPGPTMNHTVAVEPVKPQPTQPTDSDHPNVIYHRVQQDGKQGPEIACKSDYPFAKGKSPAELAAIAKQYGVGVDEVERWHVCVN